MSSKEAMLSRISRWSSTTSTRTGEPTVLRAPGRLRHVRRRVRRAERIGDRRTGGDRGVRRGDGPTGFVLGVSPALALPLLIGLYLGQRERTGRAGDIAFLANLIGLGLFGGAVFTSNMALLHLDEAALSGLLQGPTRWALLGSAAAFVVGTIMFAVTMLRAGVYPRVAVFGYGAALSLLALLAPLPDTPLISGIHVAAGAFAIWLAAALWPMATAGAAPLGASVR
jgi:hypothetical protein